MIVYFFSVVPLLFLPADASSIRDRNFRNDLVPLFGSRLDSSKKNADSLKIVSNEPFIIQFEMPRERESARKGAKEKDTKRKRPTKKRVSKLKPLRKRTRRDLQNPKIDSDRERKSDRLEISETGQLNEHRSENVTKNSINRADVLKALSAYAKKNEAKKSKKDAKAFQKDEEKETKHVTDKSPEANVGRLSSSPVVKMVYPSAPKADKHLHKYTIKDFMSDRDRLEKKIKYIRDMMNLSATDEAIRVRRRSESDRTANKIAKMFLTLSAVNGLHDKLRSKCDDEDEEDNYEEGYGLWERERERGKGNPGKRSTSSNEERYKVKKWIEHLKNKRSSSKTCPCMVKEREEEGDVFPLEQKLPKSYYLFQKGGGSDESSEAYGYVSNYHRDKLSKGSHYKRRNHKARDEQENKLKALSGKGKKLDLSLDDLELYRMKAKQILQNAEEILDKIKEEEEKRLASPNNLMNQLKELTSRIQTDPRNKENDLIRKMQKTLGLSSTSKSPEGTEGSGFLENVKSFILDPYEKAKALTDESTKKLSSYLLRNLGEVEEPSEPKEDAEDLGQEGERDKAGIVSLGRENTSGHQSKGKESFLNCSDTVSSISAVGDENKKIEDWSFRPEEQFKKRMEDIMKEQKEKLSGYKGTEESEESSNEFSERTGSRKEEQDENEIVELERTLKEDETAAPLQHKKDEIIHRDDSTENDKTGKIDEDETVRESTIKDSGPATEKGDSEEAKEYEKGKRPKDEESQKEVLKEIFEKFDEKEKSEPEVASSLTEGGKERDGANEESDSVELVHEKSNNPEEIPEEVVAVTPEKKEEKSSRVGSKVDPKSGYDYDGTADEGSDEKIEAKKPGQPKEDKSDEETVVGDQKELEAEPNSEINSPDIEDTVGLNDPKKSNGDELQKENDEDAQTEKSQEEIKSPKAEEYQDLLKESKPDESLEKIKSNEEEDEAEAEKDEREDTLQLETPTEGRKPEGNNAAKKNVYETSGDDNLSKGEDQEGLSGASLGGESPKEDFDERKKEVSDDKEEAKSTEDSPLGSDTSKEFIKEAPSRQHSDEDGDVVSKIDKPAEEVSDPEESTAILKEANEEVEETQFSGEETTPLKAILDNRSSEKDEDVKADEEKLRMTPTSEEKLESSERSDEASLKSALDKSQESDRDAGTNQMSANDEDSETQNVDEETGDKLRSAKPSLEVDDGDLESSKEKDGNEVVSKERKEESFDEGEEIRLEAANPTEGQNGAIQDADNADVTVPRKESSEETLGAEREDEDTLSKAPDIQDLKNAKEESEETSSEKLGEINRPGEKDATVEGIVKAAVKDTDKESFEEDDKKADSLSEQKLKMAQKPLKHEAVDTTKEAEADLDDNTLENEDNSDEISLKATNNEDNIGGLNAVEEDDDPVRATLDGKSQETTRRVDDDTTLKSANIDDDADELKEDKNSGENTLMESMRKDDQLSSKEADETPLKSTFADEIADTAEQDKNEGVGDDIPLGVTANKDNEEPLEVVEAPLEETRNNDDEETLEYEAPLRAEKVNDDRNDEETGNRNKIGEKAPDVEGALDDDLAAGTDGRNFVKAKSPEEAHHEKAPSVEENSSRAANSEELSNNIADDGDTLRATDDLNHPESLGDHDKEDSEETLREVNIPDDFNNRIDGKDEDETPLRSVESPVGRQEEEAEEGYENLKQANPLADSGETEDQVVSSEDESPLTAPQLIQQAKFQKDPEELTVENLRELNPSKHPLKTNTLKVPKSIGKIMKDLEGPEKGDITKLENLNPEKIDQIIDKIDEKEQQNKVTDGVDCWKECACAEDINTRSRNIGRYEIAKDFLLWMKDLQLNRVLSDD